MKNLTKPILVGLLLSMALLAAACPKRTTIDEIEADPGRFNNKTVAIAGVVKTGYGLSMPVMNGGGGIYKIDDGTGSIWVMTKKGVPSRDTQLGVKGKIASGVTYKGRNYGLVLIEDGRKYRKN